METLLLKKSKKIKNIEGPNNITLINKFFSYYSKIVEDVPIFHLYVAKFCFLKQFYYK